MQRAFFFVMLLAICSSSDILDFQRSLYDAVDTKEAAELAKDFKPRYDQLAQAHDGELSDLLYGLNEFRREDLTVALDRIDKVKEVLDHLDPPMTLDFIYD